MILIADSGSTKTAWCFAEGGRSCCEVVTSGLNPALQDDSAILAVLIGELLPQVDPQLLKRTTTLCFYGAGVLPQQVERMENLLREAFFKGDELHVDNDLTGAARALFQHDEGIACILGTGSNSGLYNGHSITDNVSPLGYILGDEGSGAVMGKHLVGALYKRQLPDHLVEAFARETGLTAPEVIRRVYREPLPNRFLASLAPFVARHLDDSAMRQFSIAEFRAFFRRNIAVYGRSDLPVGIVGSVAWHFAAPVREAAAAEGFCVQTIVQHPLPGLVAYHSR